MTGIDVISMDLNFSQVPSRYWVGARMYIEYGFLFFTCIFNSTRF